MIKLTGQLTDIGGNPIPNGIIEFVSKRNSGESLNNSLVTERADINGNYSFSLKYGEFYVYAQVSRQSDVEPLGEAVITDDVVGELTLEEILKLSQPLYPEEIQEMKNILAEIHHVQTDVEKNKSITSDLVEQSKVLAQRAVQSEQQAGKYASDAEGFKDATGLLLSQAQEAAQDASNSSEQASVSSVSAKNSALSAEESAQKSADSEGVVLKQADMVAGIATQVESDKSEINAMKADVEILKSDSEVFKNQSSIFADAAATSSREASVSASESREWAVGPGANTIEESANNNNAKYWAQIAKNNANQTFKSGGWFTPSDIQEYPDASSIEVDTIWIIRFGDEYTTYTYTGGVLSGITVKNGWLLFYDTPSDEWFYIPTSLTGASSVNGITPDSAGNIALSSSSFPDILSSGDINDALSAKVDLSDSRLSDPREWSAATVSQSEAESGTDTVRRAWTVQRIWQSISAWWNASSFKVKLDSIEDGATSNATNSELRDRSTHTGTQGISTITGLQAELDRKINQNQDATAATLPVGDSPRGSEAEIRYNRTLKRFEGWDVENEIFSGLGGGGVSNLEIKTGSFEVSKRGAYAWDLSSEVNKIVTVPEGFSDNDWFFLHIMNWPDSDGFYVTIQLVNESFGIGSEFDSLIVDRRCSLTFQKISGAWNIVDGIGLNGNYSGLENRLKSVEQYPTAWIEIGANGHASFLSNAYSGDGETYCRWLDRETYQIKGILRGAVDSAPVVKLPDGYESGNAVYQFFVFGADSDKSAPYAHIKPESKSVIALAGKVTSWAMFDWQVYVKKVES
ncbi:prophage tail fiber N-terminal domain-containing protein [Vibrio rhizosphaerae]|uniref:Prophage tail fiber N-terminal domain-containing protein n=1 Tax=Vibrio rhizosphaerae TaxID=398736 RepID=A0ABU4IZA3_9VIBR|nr:prophage tail fiber N-terminal domain-containing protein [Vibrio rhizosphaerae]MDW6094056.1 prophage tail fiber N-terminal domain-containing protein [Vibrio rhizosphaerae]